MTHGKRLEGVRLTEELEALVEECRMSLPTSTGDGDRVVHRRIEDMTVDRAAQTVRDYHASKSLQKTAQDVQYLPIPVVQAMRVIWQQEEQSPAAPLARLEKSLRASALVFTAPPPAKPDTDEQRKFRKRMQRLRLKQEETSYRRLTNNIESEQGDDINARSMTYAASVGLNMIIAPLSFGCFMYFFAGSLLDWVFGNEFDDGGRQKANPGAPDIKRVLIGVVSGVAMLFIEMILFVIRTHEFEKHTRRKAMKQSNKAFGPYTSNTPRDTVVASQSNPNGATAGRHDANTTSRTKQD